MNMYTVFIYISPKKYTFFFCSKEVLTGYNNADVTISLPDGLTLRDIKWFAVWCRAYEVSNFSIILL